MQLVYITVTLFLVSFISYTGGNRQYKSVLSVSNGGSWGTWRWKELCPVGFYAAGFSLKVEYPINGDDTALNGIRLYCVDTVKGKSLFSNYRQVTSSTGDWGEWTSIKWCKSGLLMSFQLQVETPQGNGDDTAANNIRFQCSGDDEELVGSGTNWGNWGGWSKWCRGTGICGLQTKIEGKQGSGDDTTLNDVDFFCCE